MLLCQFLVLVENRFCLYIVLCTWSTIQLWCCVSFFGSGGKLFLVLRTYLVYNTVVQLCEFFLLWRESFLRPEIKKVLVSVWPVVLLCQFLVLAGNRQFFCCGGKVLLRPEKKIPIVCLAGCAVVSVFGSGRK